MNNKTFFDPYSDGTDLRIKEIDAFKFSVIRFYNTNGSYQRLYVSGLDEYALHYDIHTTVDIILALIDFRKDHTGEDIDFGFPRNSYYMDKIITFERMAYPTEGVTEDGLIELFDLVADCNAYSQLKENTGFDYERDFYAQVSGYYADTVEELHNLRQWGEAEMRPKSRWLSMYGKSSSRTVPKQLKPQIQKDDKPNRMSENPNYNNWRNKILNRDKVCQCCGLDKHLQVHHLFGYKEHPELATNENNGITLCKFCHNKYHSVYGLKNINPLDFMKFMDRFKVRQ